MTAHVQGMSLCWAIGVLTVTSGCAVVPRSQLIACQRYNCDLQDKNQQLLAQHDQLQQRNGELAGLAGYPQERDQLGSSYQATIFGRSGPLPGDVQFKLGDFARRHPDFVEVDPRAGSSKFHSDVLFPSGEAELSPQAEPVLREFADILQDPAARALKIMVVGHTDTQRIAKDTTRTRHETNWHLSAHRAVAVTRFLQQAGVEPERMGVVGYGPHQPLALDSSPDSLARNRRVEIYVLAPDVPLIGQTGVPARY